MSPEEQAKIEMIITQFKYFTKNSETNMQMPFSEKLLYDKKFTNIAQAVLKKAMMHGPKNIYYDKYGKHLIDLNQIYTVGLENQLKVLEM